MAQDDGAPSAWTNALGQAVGPEVPGWSTRPAPPRTPMPGRYCRLEALDPVRRGRELFEAYALDASGRNWTYLFANPPSDFADYERWLRAAAVTDDPLFFAVIDLATGRATGIASYMRIDRAYGVVEVGHINYSPLLQRTRAATEAMYLLMARAFDLGYRRYEWKCDSLNAPSRAAALRLGFQYEGLFRQAIIYKGRSRDTAWYAIIDRDWPALRAAYEAWLDPANFDAEGRQRVSLVSCISRSRQCPSGL